MAEYSGLELRAIRGEQGKGGMSVTEGAYKAGISAAYLAGLESGRERLNEAVIVKIASGWMLSTDWLLARLRVTEKETS